MVVSRGWRLEATGRAESAIGCSRTRTHCLTNFFLVVYTSAMAVSPVSDNGVRSRGLNNYQYELRTKD
jgi:hypothetical protein